MVSLVNFKNFSEEIQQRDPRRPSERREQLSDRTNDGPEGPARIAGRGQSPAGPKSQRQTAAWPAKQRLDRKVKVRAESARASHRSGAGQVASGPPPGTTIIAMPAEQASGGQLDQLDQLAAGDDPSQPANHDKGAAGWHANHSRPVTNFTITWRNLKFAIEPKWHERLAGSPSLGRLVGRLASRAGPMHPGATPASGSLGLASGAAGALAQPQQAAAAGQAATRVVLDRLDGSFKSGELTAILGPSGAGKTTLLDCLTGHRKHGLSGSIRISCSAAAASEPALPCCCPIAITSEPAARPVPAKNLTPSAPSAGAAGVLVSGSTGAPNACRRHHDGKPRPPADAGDNLKVSIIPQNDHLMGHLTVYETLSYASKMKNCFDKPFNHKLNIRRVAQQLGLMSCLATRVNKLSGGQYKRVSIAQELLSSPDILILDEPTSGLDAMTCYQTVQVLKRLTDETRTASDGAQKQIAVILTIHQPNSDVFQQFNNVYVVAQGGKCIYEGPPAGIESAVNRVGIRLPSTYYNPATMIVEIAAGKFGAAAIQKLNAIQRKQYEFIYLNDEQNSTGDSAVDCPSSSSSSSSSDNEEDDAARQQTAAIDADNYPETISCDSIRLSKQVEINNNNNNNNKPIEPLDGGGLTNKGFTLEDEQQPRQLQDSVNRLSRVEALVVNNNSNSNGGAAETLAGAAQRANCSARRAAEDPPAATESNKRKKRRRKRTQPAAKCEPVIPMDHGGAKFDCQALKATAFGPDDKLGPNVGGGAGGAGGAGGREKRLKLNSLKAEQRFPFWRHTYLHFHRSWLSIVRDPMLCSMQLALHIIVPVMVSLVYGTGVGKPNACPRAGPVDIMAYALEPADAALQLQEDLRTTLENIGYIFFKLYGIIFAAMTVTVLTFPLDMHVLVKEFRNGWYGLSSYFLGRTLADIPFQLTLPLLAMSLSYYATGQPYSYLQWRFLSITGILILSSLIAQSQGLLFGAILMDKMKAAVFVAPAATTPIILFAGFLVRTQSIPRYLRPLSNLSYLRYAIEACLISRYGFNQCECDPAIFNQTVPELPPIARSMLDYWLGSFRAQGPASASASDSAAPANETTTLSAPEDRPDLFTKLIDSLAKANSFGRNITSCEQVVPYPMIDYDLKDSQLASCFAILVLMLLATRFLTFFIVCFKVKRKV